MERSQVLVLVVMFLSCSQVQPTITPSYSNSTVVMATTWISNITGTNATLQSTGTTSQLSRSPSPSESGTPPGGSSTPSSTPHTSSTSSTRPSIPQTDIQPSAATRTPAVPSQSSPGGDGVTSLTPGPSTAGSGCVSAGRRLQQLLLAASCMLLQRAAHT